MRSMKLTAVGTGLTAILLSGCAANPDQAAMDTERRLGAAGFQVKLADTPEKLNHLKFMADRRLMPTSKDGETVWVYADAKGCKCVYVGSQKNYQEYQRIAIHQEDLKQQRETAQANKMSAETNAQMNWDMWGPWPRPIIW